MVKYVKTIKGFTMNDMLRTGGSLGLVGVTSAVGKEVGSLVGGYIASTYVCKTDFSKKFVMAISVLNAIDLFLERIIPRGVI